MQYHEALQTFGKRFDPFLHILAEEIVDEVNGFFVIPARAPYIEDHLLIIPKRKVYVMKDLTHQEKEEMFELLENRTLKLHKYHPDVNLLLRDGLVGGHTEKSVNHLHFHLIPDCPIGAQGSLNNTEREFFNNKKYADITKDIKNKFLN